MDAKLGCCICWCNPCLCGTSTMHKLSKEEKVRILTSLISGMGNSYHFDVDELKERYKSCLKLAEEVL